jgi:BirA family transcriptional regulator, biotin operon repressor / biotin---[acetyl-CoA-carboxylase] ligase
MSPAPRLPAGCRLLTYARLGSTNDEARNLAHAGAGEGTIVWAHEQDAGRGRRGRQWHRIAGNLYLSIILRPNCPPTAAAQLGFIAALGVGEAAAALLPPGAELRYKWPNDVLVNGAKISGILLESEMMKENRLDWVVVGVGVNVAGHPPQLGSAANSLRALGCTEIDAAGMLERFCEHFMGWVGRWRNSGFSGVRAAWLARAAGLGQPMIARLDKEDVAGHFAGLDGDGALLLDTGTGTRRITAGDVFPARR